MRLLLHVTVSLPGRGKDAELAMEATDTAPGHTEALGGGCHGTGAAVHVSRAVIATQQAEGGGRVTGEIARLATHAGIA